MPRHIYLTIDTEAQPARATQDHVDRLIWGRWGSEDFGIGRMMDIADKYGAKLCFFIDFCEYYLYGEDLLDVAREVVRRGHDAQIHLHPEFLPRELGIEGGQSWNQPLNTFDKDAAPRFADHFVALAEKAIGTAPSAYRGGAFRFSPAIDTALYAAGLRLSSNYYSRAKYWPAAKPHAKFFRWPSGMYELPMSTTHVDGRHRGLVFEDYPVHEVPALSKFANSLDQIPGELCVLDVLIHSWSLLARAENGQFVGPDEKKVLRLEGLLQSATTLGLHPVDTPAILKAAASHDLPTIAYGNVFRGSLPDEPDFLAVSSSLEERFADRATSGRARHGAPRIDNSAGTSGALQATAARAVKPWVRVAERWLEDHSAEQDRNGLVGQARALVDHPYLNAELATLGEGSNDKALEALLSGNVHLSRETGQTVEIRNFSWDAPGLEDRTRLWLLQQWIFVRECAREWRHQGTFESLKLVGPLLRSWCDLNLSSLRREDDLAWHDHSTALRAISAVYYILLLAKSGADIGKEFPRLRDFVHLHLIALSDERFYTKGTNHGFDQAFALYLLGHVLDIGELSAEAAAVGRLRLADEIGVAFTAEGVHIENSPSYHALMMERLLAVKRLLDAFDDRIEQPDLDRLFHLALECLIFMIRPDRRLPMLGDSANHVVHLTFENHPLAARDTRLRYVMSAGAEGTAPLALAKVYRASGYAFFRDRWCSQKDFDQPIHLTFKSAFLSTYHRHDDDNTILLYAYGEDWLIDGGLFRYHEREPHRLYLRSSLAHNIVSVMGVAASRRPPPRDKGSNFTAWNTAGPLVYAGARSRMYPGFDYERRLAFHQEDQWIELLDILTPDADEPHDFEQRFHFLADKRIAILDPRSVLVHSARSDRWLLFSVDHGEFDSVELVKARDQEPMAGWTSPSLGELAPAQTLIMRCKGRHRFESRVHLSFGSGEVPSEENRVRQRELRLMQAVKATDFEARKVTNNNAVEANKSAPEVATAASFAKGELVADTDQAAREASPPAPSQPMGTRIWPSGCNICQPLRAAAAVRGINLQPSSEAELRIRRREGVMVNSYCPNCGSEAYMRAIALILDQGSELQRLSERRSVILSASERPASALNVRLPLSRHYSCVRHAADDPTAFGIATFARLPAGEADLILCHGVLDYVEDLGAVFGHVRRALAPGGAFLFFLQPWRIVAGDGLPTVVSRNVLADDPTMKPGAEPTGIPDCRFSVGWIQAQAEAAGLLFKRVRRRDSISEMDVDWYAVLALPTPATK